MRVRDLHIVDVEGLPEWATARMGRDMNLGIDIFMIANKHSIHYIYLEAKGYKLPSKSSINHMIKALSQANEVMSK